MLAAIGGRSRLGLMTDVPSSDTTSAFMWFLFFLFLFLFFFPPPPNVLCLCGLCTVVALFAQQRRRGEI
jgi:hypothetical protein